MVIVKALAWPLWSPGWWPWYAGTVRSPVIGANAKAAHFRGATKMARTEPGRNER